jgi:hypothetical protein
MRRTSYIKRRAGTFHWRRRVPLHLIARFGTREISCTLRTSDAAIAATRARRLAAESDRLFDHIDHHLMLSQNDIQRLAQKWLRQTIERVDEAHARGDAKTPQQVSARQAEAAATIQELQQKLAANDLAIGEVMAKRVLGREGISLDVSSDAFKQLCRALMRAGVEGARAVSARLDGRYDYEPADKMFRSHGASGTDPDDQRSPLLSALIQEYLISNSTAWTVKTVEQYRRSLKIFIDVVGDQRASAIDRRDISKYIDALGKLPRLHGRSRRGGSGSAPAGKPDARTPSIVQKTVNRHLTAVSGLFTWARRHGKVEIANPVSGLIDKKKAEATSRSRVRDPQLDGWRDDERR